MRAIGQEHQQRTVEKVLNLALNNNNPADEPSSPKDRVMQHHGSLEMLTRVFPFHPKTAVESALETCGGDVAKAVQQLVGHQAPSPASLPAPSTEEGTMAKSNNLTSGKSAFLPTSSASSFPSPVRPLYDQMAVPTSSSMSMPQSTNNLMAYPSALRMMSSMSSYPSAGMMSFLHPSAYFAAAASAAAAAAASPHSYPWLFPNHYGSVRPLVQQHLCLPGCSVCPISTGTSSTSSSISPGENGAACTKGSALMIATDDLFKSNGRKEMYGGSKS